MFQACLMVIPNQVVCFENHAEWRFCLAPFWCVAPGRRSGARLAQWPERVVASFLCSRLVSCTCALLWMFILTHATALKPFHSKQSYPLHHLQPNNRLHSVLDLLRICIPLVKTLLGHTNRKFGRCPHSNHTMAHAHVEPSDATEFNILLGSTGLQSGCEAHMLRPAAHKPLRSASSTWLQSLTRDGAVHVNVNSTRKKRRLW